MDGSTLPASPITFKARSFVADVRFNVFGTIMHVHSTVLKLHSQYFSSFLDAPDSATSVGGTAFKYDWTTKVVDEGRDWQLVSNNDRAGALDLQRFKGDKKRETLGFYKLMLAIYGMPFVLMNAEEFFRITAMARFYAALPALSRFLSNVFPRSPGFLREVPNYAIAILSAAKELRHPELFKDCLMLCLGPWGCPKTTCILDSQTLRAATRARNAIGFEVSQVQESIVRLMGLNHYTAPNLPEVIGSGELGAARMVKDNHMGGEQSCLPCYYRHLYNANIGNLTGLKQCIKPLLENRLRLVDAMNITDRRNCHFLGIVIPDDDLPWDQTQIDW